MKPIFIALLSEITCFVIVTIQFNLKKPVRRAKAMIIVFFSILPVLFVLHFIIPSDLGFLPLRMISPSDWIDLIFSFFLYVAGFFGGVLQLYNLSDRGFSIRILIDIYEHPTGSMNLDDIMINYSQGHGIDWMYEKRISNMVDQGLVYLSKERIVNTKKGNIIGYIFYRLRKLFKLPIPEKNVIGE